MTQASTATSFALSLFTLADFADILPQPAYGLLVEEVTADRVEWVSTGFFTADIAA